MRRKELHLLWWLTLVACYLLIVGVGTSLAAPPSPELQRIFRTFNSSAIRITALPGDLQATGFLTRVAEDPDFVVLISNYHVFKSSAILLATIPASDSSGRVVDTFLVPVVLKLQSNDIAYVRPLDTTIDLAAIAIRKTAIQTKNKGYLSSYPEQFFSATTKLFVTQPVWFFGYPLGQVSNRFEPIVRTGTIAAIDTQRNLIYLDADAFGGSSGSPVFLNIYDVVNQFDGAQLPIGLLVGVIQGNISSVKSLINPQNGAVEMIQTENSGLAVVIPTNQIAALSRRAISAATGIK